MPVGRSLVQVRPGGSDDCRHRRLRAIANGTFGKTGIQSLCDLLDLPYVGSTRSGRPSGLTSGRKAVFLAAGIPTSPARMLQGADLEDPALVEAACLEIGFPMVLKATREGSSFGVAIVRDSKGFQSALAAVRTCSDMILFEKFQKGREFSVPVIEDPLTGLPRALPVIEIVVHKAEFFVYSTKYDPNAADEICPAPIEPDLAGRMSAAAIKAHRALMLSGYSRTDFIATADGCIWALETNTLPGMTAFSLLPKSAAVAGITYPSCLTRLSAGLLPATRRTAANNSLSLISASVPMWSGFVVQGRSQA